MRLLKILRFEDILLLAATQFIFYYGFLKQQAGLPLALVDWQFALLVLASVLIASGGYLMEAITGADKYNAGISESNGYNIYAALNLAAIVIGYYLSDFIGKPGFVAIFVISASMLYFAVTNFRQTLLVGNILIALNVAFAILAVGIYCFYPMLVLEVKEYFVTMFKVLTDYAFFGFIMALIYTLVKDLENSDIDYNTGKTTLPIVLGRARTAKVVFALTIVPVVLLLYYAQTYMTNLLWALGYGLALVLGPLIYALIKLWGAKTTADFRHISIVLKLVMAFAVLSIVVITLNINYNA